MIVYEDWVLAGYYAFPFTVQKLESLANATSKTTATSATKFDPGEDYVRATEAVVKMIGLAKI